MADTEDAPPEVIELAPLTRAEAEATMAWRYPPELSTYDPDADGLEAMLDPINRYQGIHRGGAYIGYVCLGAEARVPGLSAAPGVEDFGMGLMPQLVGRGLSRWLLPAILAQLTGSGVLAGHTVRAVILDWNRRSERAALAAGFTPVGELPSREGRFIVMHRPLG